MNRRSFIERLALGMAGFTILPGAGRVWVAIRKPMAPHWAIPSAYSEFLSDDYFRLLEDMVRSHAEIEARYPRKTLYDFLMTRKTANHEPQIIH